MLSSEQWWAIIESYGTTIWPAQVVLGPVAVVLVGYLFLRPGRTSNLLVKAYLTATFVWMGFHFFMAFRPSGPQGSYLFGTLFVIVGLLFAVDLYRQGMDFHLPRQGWQRYLTLVLAALVLAYPLYGLALGHPGARLIAPGTHPCPTTALALLLMTTALPRVDKVIYIMLLVWAVPFPPLVQLPKYGVYEDAVMFAVGLYALVMLIRRWR